jgi:hypothetical protein
MLVSLVITVPLIAGLVFTGDGERLNPEPLPEVKRG